LVLTTRLSFIHCRCAWCIADASLRALQRTLLSDEDIKSEVTALEQQGHRRLLVLTGEHPKYTFDQFLHVSSRSIATCSQCANVSNVSCSAARRSVEGLLACWNPHHLQ
jgi:2-iminoacetate synthase ThiH